MKKRSGFKMRSGNKPDMTKLAGITKADSKQTDGRAKSSAFQADKEEFPGLVDFEVEVKGKDETRDILARKARAGRSGSVNPGMEQSAIGQDYEDADKALATSKDFTTRYQAQKRLKDRAANIKKVKAARKNNPNITQAEINKIMSGN